ncbi:MAG: MFS transporter [Hyphomicrobiales bacterium]
MEHKKDKRSFPATFWSANIMELFERLAWYGMFMILAIYLTGPVEKGGLGFSQEQKGILMGTVSAILYLLPILTGSIADKLGYKKVLYGAFITLIVGYIWMGHVYSYVGMWFAFLLVAIGAAQFKPIISATVAKTTNSKNASLGFGIFYMLINIGGFLGPLIASHLRNTHWSYVFIMSGAAIVVNLFIVTFGFKEPARENKNVESMRKTLRRIAKDVYTVLLDWRFLVFLLIIIGFWTMYFQMFFSLPVFIEQWIDTAPLYGLLHSVSPALAGALGTPEHTINPEIITNMDPFFIIIFQLLISAISAKLKPVNSIIYGIVIATIGSALTFVFKDPLYIIVGILIFAVGEMASSPKITEYIGRIAPKEKTGLYMGMSFLPVAGGNFIGGLVSGFGYQRLSDKYQLLQYYLDKKGINIPSPTSGHYDTYWQNACDKLHMTSQQLNDVLWNTYHPYNFWIVIAIIGIAAALILFLFNTFVTKGNNVNVKG